MPMSDVIKRLLEQAIVEKLFPGVVVGIVKKRGKKKIIPGGRFTYDDNSSVVKEDSIFDVASVTKCIPTASLALWLIDNGKLSEKDQLIKYLPEFNNSDRDKVLIKHLLTQTMKFGFRLSDHKDETPDEILKMILTAEFNGPPGKEFFYTNASSILLGLVIERIMGDSLDKLGEKYFFEPLEMQRTTFWPLKKFKIEDIVPTEISAWRGGVIQGEVHDESAFILQKKFVPGNAGLFTTAGDLLKFLEMLIDGDKGYFSEKIIMKMETNQLVDIGASHALGWEVNQPRYMGKSCGKHAFGKTGFTGCVVVADREKGKAFVLLSNCKYPKRTDNIGGLDEVRSKIADLVWNS